MRVTSLTRKILARLTGEIHRTFGVSRPLSSKSIFGGRCFRLAHGWVKAKNDRIHPEVRKAAPVLKIALRQTIARSNYEELTRVSLDWSAHGCDSAFGHGWQLAAMARAAFQWLSR